jgi:uncharacterized protein (DUF2062 family)
MKPCVLIPCYNHSATVGAVAQAALTHAPVIVVDDGSTEPLPELSGCEVVRLKQNSGKATALRAGFQRAVELGFTHAVTIDADGQHFAEDLPKFLTEAQQQPEAYLVGVRNFREAGCPTHRRRSNAISTFWYRVETGVRLRDTQCGFRCYPLPLVQQLQIRSDRYAYELEFMVRAAWVGTAIVAIPVKCTYEPGKTGTSHFRTVRDFVHITNRNIILVFQTWLVPLSLRVDWSRGQKNKFGHVLHEFFTEHAHEPGRLASSVGLGLFFGIVPIYGFQMVVAATVAHKLRVNKAITLLASNISIPPVAPFIFCAALVLGHWLLTGEVLELSPQLITRETLWEYLGDWLFGSLALAIGVSVIGTIVTYGIARLVRWKG